MKLAIYVITVAGEKQAAKLKQAMPFAHVFGTANAIQASPNARLLTLPLSNFVADRFNDYDAHVFICASGIVSRIIGPLLKDKTCDPAVVCMDEQGKFAISMLSGHRGGANQLTQRVAHIVKGTPVITTASDVSETVSADMLGAPFGWVLDPISEPSITKVSAAIVNEAPVIIVQQAGDKNWWKYDKRMPASIISHTSLQGIESEHYQGAILVTDELNCDLTDWQNKVVLWRPKSLVLGIGCDRNTPLCVLKSGLQAFSQQFNLSLDSVDAFASIDLKADEIGLQQLSQEKQWPFITYAPEQLDAVEGIEHPSEYVKKVTGSNSVAEAAALTLSRIHTLLVPKWVFKQDGYNMTIACCRKSFTEPLIRHKRKNWFGEKKHGSDSCHGVYDVQPQTRDVQTEVTAQQIKVNAYGNEVVAGYQCKPKHVDLDRPMLFYKHHILICEGKRCVKQGSKNLAHDLRAMLKQQGLASGPKRIKISRTMCVGACRNRSTLVIYEKNAHAERSVNNAIWLRGVEAFSEQQWQALFHALANNQPVIDVVDSQYLAPIHDMDGGLL
ncbi:cobalamin biosynthesis protein [Vibrio rarus]|uniref:cobalamin biosynthesis protein n=1 Tax=Vibrio rarus TaxID=413403 RepID=UPI0021C347F0|nr:cobalamin biosynthesis protein [Vibrio rarus]